jgi:hypothetical protein
VKVSGGRDGCTYYLRRDGSTRMWVFNRRVPRWLRSKIVTEIN